MDDFYGYSPYIAHHHTADSGGPASMKASSRPSPAAVSGNGKMKFRVLYTSDHLPEEARKALVSTHGGFAVDHRPDKGETYFALPGAGILQISADLQRICLIPTPDELKAANLHSTAVWYAPDGEAFLAFASNN